MVLLLFAAADSGDHEEEVKEVRYINCVIQSFEVSTMEGSKEEVLASTMVPAVCCCCRVFLIPVHKNLDGGCVLQFLAMVHENLIALLYFHNVCTVLLGTGTRKPDYVTEVLRLFFVVGLR